MDTEKTSPTVERILALVDIDGATDRTLAYAAHMAHLFGARLRVTHLVEPLASFVARAGAAAGASFSQLQGSEVADHELPDLAETLEERLRSRVAGLGLPEDRVEVEVRQVPFKDLVEAKSAGFDLIVVAGHDRPWLERLLLEDPAAATVRLADCPVLVVPESVDSETEPPSTA